MKKLCFHLKIVCPILLQEKEEGLRSNHSSITTARNAHCFKGLRTFKKWVANGTNKSHFDCKINKPRYLAIYSRVAVMLNGILCNV